MGYAFVPGRREARVLEIDTLLELAGKPRVNEHVELRFEVQYTAADAVEITLRGATTTATDVAGIQSTLGATFKQKFAKNGATQAPEANFPPGAEGAAKAYVQGALSQVSATMVPLVPTTPVGEDARWTWGNADGPRARLVSRKDTQIVVEQTTEIHGKRKIDTGKRIQVDEDQRSRIEAPLDGIARHIDSTLVADRERGTKRTMRVRFDAIDKP